MPSQEQEETPDQSDEAPPVPPRGAVIPGDCSCSAVQSAVQCVLVGDEAVGKSSLLVSYTVNGYPEEYVPTALNYFTVKVLVGTRPVQLWICDIAGQDTFERLRPLCYRDADVFLLCYSVIVPSSFRSVRDRWAPEVRRLCPEVPVILVGTQADLREDVQVLIRLAQQQERPASEDEALLCAQNLGAAAFFECSALTQKNLKAVFDVAIVLGLGHAEQPKEPAGRLSMKEIRQLSKTWWQKHSCFM